MGNENNLFEFSQFYSLTNWGLKGATRWLYNYVKRQYHINGHKYYKMERVDLL